MFTGIIAEMGKIISKTGNELIVSAPKLTGDLKPGDSISVNGACVTAAEITPPNFRVSLLDETLKRTNLGKQKTGTYVNLELALRADDRFGGHMVTGHIDCTGKLIRSYRKGNDHIFEIEVPFSIIKYLTPKGSVAIDGVSLTIVKVIRNRFTVHLIPYTLKYTTLNRKKIGNMFNIEIDILSRYAKD